MPAFSEKAAQRGEPSYVWRSGQERRLAMIRAACAVPAPRVLDDGCGLGAYTEKMAQLGWDAYGLDFEADRVAQARRRTGLDVFVRAAAEHLPYPDRVFDLLLSNEVIEHVQDDRAALAEMARVLKPEGRIVLFCPNRWYPVEQHGIFWRGRYHFGNIPLVNYFPDPVRNRLAPHVRTYTRRRLSRLFAGLPLRVVSHRVIFGGYDNLSRRLGAPGSWLKLALHSLEGSPLATLGLSHVVVLEKVGGPPATIASAPGQT